MANFSAEFQTLFFGVSKFFFIQESWTIRGGALLAATCTVIFLVAILASLLQTIISDQEKIARSTPRRKSRRRQEGYDKRQSNILYMEEFGTWMNKPLPPEPPDCLTIFCSPRHLGLTFLHLLATCLKYFIMIAVMTFNIWFIISALLGTLVGNILSEIMI